MYIITCDDRHFEVSQPVAELVKMLKAKKSIEEISQKLSQKKGEKFSPSKIEELIDTYINPILEANGKKVNSYIWLKKDFISDKTLRPLTNLLSHLFKPEVVAVVTACILIGQGYLFIYATDAWTVGGNTFSFTSFLFAGVLFFLSIIFHELGHASACRYYGITHGHIGVGLYLHFPVFYADVSNIWKLKRGQRVVVDLAGIYFQLVFLLPVILAWSITGDAKLKYVVFAINLSFLFDLNPFFRFDGYWVVTDLLGIANLRQRTNEAISYIMKKLRGQAITKTPYLFKINNREKYVFIGYVILSNLFFGYYILYRMPVFLYNFGKTVPDDLQLLFSSYKTGTPFNFDLLGSVLVQLAFILLSFYILIKISVRIRRYTTDKIL
ncbi:MAG: hypothetical protein CL666_17125 [Balneola sp.]|nr:hypothetical protein [Balneola sp.]|tara:strand:+ start:3199 stop:4344 length:1146 start_codon:yes stop_codon:yes gene_type:complete